MPDKASLLKGLDLVAGGLRLLITVNALVKGLNMIFQCVAGLQQVANLLVAPLACFLQPDHCALRFVPYDHMRVWKTGLFLPLLAVIERCGGNQFLPIIKI
jgi:hypothetical protein